MAEEDLIYLKTVMQYVDASLDLFYFSNKFLFIHCDCNHHKITEDIEVSVKTLYKVAENIGINAEKITGTNLPSIQDLYNSRIQNSLFSNY